MDDTVRPRRREMSDPRDHVSMPTKSPSLESHTQGVGRLHERSEACFLVWLHCEAICGRRLV